MKKFFEKLFGGMPDEEPKAEPIVGISDGDWMHIYNEISRELESAKSRQKSPDAAPTGYMKGLYKALEILDTCRPYNILEVL